MWIERAGTFQFQRFLVGLSAFCHQSRLNLVCNYNYASL
jgi:hypothetical protein